MKRIDHTRTVEVTVKQGMKYDSFAMGNPVCAHIQTTGWLTVEDPIDEDFYYEYYLGWFGFGYTLKQR